MQITSQMLSGHHRTRNFPQGKHIFDQGSTGRTMYVVIEGEVDLQVDGRTIETVHAGGVLGEMALIDRSPRAASAVAKSRCVLSAVDQRRFAELVRRSPEFSIAIMRTMAGRLRRMNRRYSSPRV